MSRRTEQIAQTLQRAIEQVLSRRLNDPRIRGLISVTGLTISEDLRQATVRVSIYPEEHEGVTLHGLQSASRHIRRQAGELVALARMPNLTFKLDRSLKRQAEVFEALSLAREDRERMEEAAGERNDEADEAAPDGGADGPAEPDAEADRDQS